MSLPAKGAAPQARWRIAILLSCGVLVNYVDRINLTVSHDALQQSFAFSDVVFGWLLSAYNLTYALCQMPAGLMLDRFGVRRLNIFSAATVSVASFGSAAASGVHSLFLARFLLGIGESPLFPANAKAVGQWFPSNERTFAMSLVDSSAKLASAVGVPLLGSLLLWLGWRRTFAFTAILTLLYLVTFKALYREMDPEREGTKFSDLPEMVETNRGLPLRRLLAEPKVIGLAIGMLAYNYSFYLMLTWLPIYLSQSLRIDLLHSFLYTGFPWLIAVLSEIAVGGWLIDMFIARGAAPGKLRLRIMVLGMGFGFAVIGVAFSNTASMALLWLTISIAGSAAATPAMWAAPSLIAPRSNVATVGSIMNFSGQVAGISAPVITGYLHKSTNGFSGAFFIAAGLQICGLLAYVVLVKEITPIRVVGSDVV
jgi:ACS family D-galactonate transporter-like MFS transporter